jgi:hypothetical protein
LRSKNEITDEIVMPANIDPGEVFQIASTDPIWAFRGHAIQAYANLEQSLCGLFARIADLRRDVAATIFFKITNTQARNSIIERLIRKRYGATYRLFWNSFLKELRPIDIKRNEVVHWNAVNSIGEVDATGRPLVRVSLVPPNYWDIDENSPEVTAQDLMDFISKCMIFVRLCNMFLLATGDKMGDRAKPWLDVFQQPLVYPLPADHPLSRSDRGEPAF